MAGKKGRKKSGKRAAPGAKASARRGAAGPTKASVTIRHYCQGIGDCHLLTFLRDDGKPFHLLIDCGVHTAVKGGRGYMDRVAADIVDRVKKDGGAAKLDVVVATHEHADHISGFVSAKETLKQLDVGEVWMGWTENPRDRQAVDLDKFKAQALAVLNQADARFAASSALDERLSKIREALPPVLGFFGVKGAQSRSARDAVAALTQQTPRYLEPTLPPFALPGVSNVRVYVLGPPRSAKMLGIRERHSEQYEVAGAGGWPMASGLEAAFGVAAGDFEAEHDWGAPFDCNVGEELSGVLAGAPQAQPAKGDYDELGDESIWTRYLDERVAWRRIDDDWLGASADLAIQLDDRTNNSSLVLAFEFVDTKRVLLFTGDAQAGSWLSWQELKWDVDGKTVTGPDLLARTVYYKVGHHGSHNATLKQKGLELMTSPDFSAFIPTNEADAQNVRWGKMPLKSIVKELKARTSGRVIRADDAWIKKGKLPKGLEKKSGSFRRPPRSEGDLYVEVEVG